jgi:hypothetical protein
MHYFMCQKCVLTFLLDRILNQESNTIDFMNFGQKFEFLGILQATAV